SERRAEGRDYMCDSFPFQRIRFRLHHSLFFTPFWVYSLFMALNIKNPEVEKLASEIADITGESKTQAIRKALIEFKGRLGSHVIEEDRRTKLMRFLEQ